MNRSKSAAVLLAVGLAAVACSPQPEATSRTTTVEPDATTQPAEDGGPSEPESSAADTELQCNVDQSVATPGLRPDVYRSGNRHVPGSYRLDSSRAVEIVMDSRPRWVTTHPSGAGWYVLLDTGEAVTVVVNDGGETTIEPAPAPAGLDDVTVPGFSDEAQPGAFPIDIGGTRTAFSNPLPDTRVVSNGPWSVALVDPTDRYGHGVLGDAIEAAGFDIVNACDDQRVRVDIDAPDVIEGVSAMLVDGVESDRDEPAVLVTLANGDVGARLALYRLDGSLIAQSDPIGSGRRWRNQLAAGPFGPDGSFAIVDVRTPHIGGTVQWFSVSAETGRLELTAASEAEYTTHVIGSRNLDLGLAVDVDDDARAEILVPAADRRTLTALTPSAEGANGVRRADAVLAIPLPGAMSTNLAIKVNGDGIQLAAGTDDGQLVIIG